jgi:hypothetical protein
LIRETRPGRWRSSGFFLVQGADEHAQAVQAGDIRLSEYSLRRPRDRGKQRVSGSHHIFGHPDFPEMLNLQSIKGKAKPYQIRQLLLLVDQ